MCLLLIQLQTLCLLSKSPDLRHMGCSASSLVWIYSLVLGACSLLAFQQECRGEFNCLERSMPSYT